MNCFTCRVKLTRYKKKYCSSKCARSPNTQTMENKRRMQLRRQLMLDLAKQFNNGQILFERAVAEINRIA